MRVDLSEPLPVCVARQYQLAKQNGSLIFSDTELTTIRTSAGVPFQLRYCPALAKKPKNDDKPKAREEKKKPDPFIDPPEDLFIANVLDSGNPSHILVLNKYPVIAEHFILATKTDKPQTDVLEPDDLQATYACLKEWERHGHGKGLFAFFNSGEHSGASQPHRHLQFLPVESMKQGDEDREWKVLADTITSRPDTSLPFTYVAKPLPTDPTMQQLYEIYTSLLAEAIVAGQSFSEEHLAERAAPGHDDNSRNAAISYNMAVTTSSMVILPRRSEGAVLREHPGAKAGSVALNGTILAGTLMVKLREEWDVLRGSTAALDGLLQSIGLPSHGKERAGDSGSGKL